MSRRFPTLAVRIAALPCLLAVAAAPALSDTPYFRFGLGTGGAAGTDGPGLPPPASQAFALTLSGFKPRIESGEAVSGSFAADAGGVTYAAEGLPPGVALSSAGVLSGQPTEPGSYTATVTATDGAGRKSSTRVALVVLPPAPSASPATDASSTLIAGMPFSATPKASGADIVSWTLAEGPSEWLRVDAATGRVAGVPPQGTNGFGYAVVGTDAHGRTVRVSDTVDLAQPYLTYVLPTSAIPGHTVYGSLSSNLPGATFSGSGLPTWLSVDPMTGLISGTVPAVSGLYRFMAAAVQGSAGAALDIPLSVTPVTLTSTLPTALTKGRTATGTLKASVGTGWAWSVLNRPSWLAVDSASGNLTASPGASDTSASGLAWQATRNGVTVSSAPFDIEVASPSVTFSSPPPETIIEGDTVRLRAMSSIAGATYSMSGAPTGSFMATDGDMSITSGDIDADRNHTVTVTARSGALSGSTSFRLALLKATATLEGATVRPNVRVLLPLATTMAAAGTWAVTTSSANLAAGPSAPKQASTDVSARATASGTYTVTATFTSTDKLAKASATATVKVLPAFVLTSQPSDQLFIVQSPRTVQGPGVSGTSAGGAVTYALLRNGSPYPASDLASECPGLAFSTADGSIAGRPTATCSVTGLSYEVSDDGGGTQGAATKANSTGTFRISVEPNELYGFASQTFGTCGKGGRLGPAASDCAAAYSTAPWASNSLYFAVDGNGKQTWTVPASGTYTFVAQGSSGGGSPGKAAQVSGSFDLVTGDKITLVVGQVGTGYGGGGGTAVFKDSAPLLVAGGAAGGRNGANASLSTSGGNSEGLHEYGCKYNSVTGGANGNGGGGSCEAGGGGILSAGRGGGNGSNNPTGGDAIGPMGSAQGGLKRGLNPNDGGFGGGGGAGFSGVQGGGGGGYSGGAGAGWMPNDYRPAGGGGSYVSPEAAGASIALAGATGGGFVTVTRQ